MLSFDVAVIGAGPGGYPCALRCAQLGLKTVVFDPMKNPDDGVSEAPGGTCANVGCIPSKALLASAHAYRAALGNPELGVTADPAAVAVDFSKVQSHRAASIRKANRGVTALFKSAGVAFVPESASFAGKDGENWLLEAGGETYCAKAVVIACGTTARMLPGIDVDEETVLTNAGALKLAQAPETLGVIGAGVIGLEIGSAWAAFGSKVMLIDVAPVILPFAGKDVSDLMLKSLSAQGMDFALGASVKSVEKVGGGVRVVYEKDGQTKKALFEKLLVAVGRSSAVAGIKPEVVGLAVDSRGAVVVDADCKTNLPGVWAIGDIVRGPQLAHKAMSEGRAVAGRIAGLTVANDVSPIPSVVYTHPECAWVGMLEDEAKKAGIAVRTGKAAFIANPRARCQDETAGFVKLVCDKTTGRVLGASVVGANASEMIDALTSAIAFGATDEDLALVVHAHPSFAESIQDAAFASMAAAGK